MTTYKVTNITNRLTKRANGYNSTLDIEVIERMKRKSLSIRPNDTLFLTVSSLPLSVHKLRMKGHLTVVEIKESDIPKPKVVVEKPKPVAKKRPPKKVAPPKKEIVEELVEVEETPVKKAGRKPSAKSKDE